ncbi:response regulator transcription factor [Thermosyntropha sp.]|uniref:response regulator transcription factor n=1 Tax=Thermosyntropha sp. TaxID=2740820 RepID=UPI0025DAE596|nr:response regulator transcription factor [Thermosyntropha sp.]MBO8158605.1 response regulator transcription factor [Thermosyntropha sp.]
MKGKILVVDDEESLVRLITYNLNKEGFETLKAYDGVEAYNLVKENNPDLIILDLMLPERDGLEVCKQLRSENINTPIIMLTAKDEEIDKVLGLELGADDYVTKPFSVRELVARVKAVLRRKNEKGLEPETKDKTVVVGSFTIKPDRYEIFHDGKLLDLTLKEYELLEIFLRNRGRVLKRNYLLEVLWDYADGANTRVLDVHVSKLRDKIEKDPKNPQYIKTVRGLGYKFEEDKNA